VFPDFPLKGLKNDSSRPIYAQFENVMKQLGRSTNVYCRKIQHCSYESLGMNNKKHVQNQGQCKFKECIM
jgi:hypothetical protein